jgi:hypothetical protein
VSRTHRARRAVGILAALASAALAPITAAPAAFASTSPGRARLLSWADPPLPPGWDNHPPLPGPAPVHAALAGAMPGWQITFIAVGAAALAAALAAATARWLNGAHSRAPRPTATAGRGR